MTTPMTFTSPERDLDKVRTPFNLDGEILFAIQPKAAILLNLAKQVNVENEEDPANIRALDEFVDICMEEATAVRLRERMADPEDGFDLDTLVQIMQALQGVWADRPTGRPNDSSGRQPTRRPGARSTGNARSVG